MSKADPAGGTGRPQLAEGSGAVWTVQIQGKRETGEAFTSSVFNYSGEFAFLWDEIRFPIKYGSNAEQARSLIETAAVGVLGDYPTLAETAWKALVKRYMLQDEESVVARARLITSDVTSECSTRS